jgi:hypothetical protein
MRCFLGLLVVLALALPGQAQTEKKPATEEISRLIDNLGSPRYLDREKARFQLEQIGEPALPQLREAAQSENLEVRMAAAKLVSALDQKLLTGKLLAPKMVRLNAKNTSVWDAIQDLSKQSGYAIQVQGDQKALQDRKITLDTGETTFWKAFDQLCREGGLQEVAAPAAPNPYNNLIAPTFNRQIQIQPNIIRKIQNKNIKIKIGNLPNGILPVPANPVPPNGVLPVPAKPAAAPVPKANLQPLNRALLAAALTQVQVGGVQPAQPKPPKFAPAIQPAQPKPPKVAPAIQPVQIQVNGIVIGNNRLPGNDQAVPNANPAGQIQVKSGKSKPLPTCYVGAVRIQVVSVTARDNDEVTIVLRASAEPHLKGFNLFGNPAIEKVIDDLGQSLRPSMESEPANPQNPFGVPIYGGPVGSAVQEATFTLKLGDKRAKTLTHLEGTLMSKVMAPTEDLARIKNVLKSTGQSVKGKDGGTMQVVSAQKTGNGIYRLEIEMDNLGDRNNPFQMLPGGGIRINGNGGKIVFQQIRIANNGVVATIGGGSTDNTPQLVDKNNIPFRVVNVPSTSFEGNNGKFKSRMTVEYQASNANQGEPADLVVTGQRQVNVDLPFRLENVPLP